MIRVGQFLFRYRNILFPILIIGGILSVKPGVPFDNPALEDWIDLVAVLVGLAGQGLRVLTIGYEYIRRGGRNGAVHADELVTGGVFAHSRNPLYVGNILLCLSVALMINSPWMYLFGLGFVVFAYWAIVRAEEDFLVREFGERYRAYCAVVNRWLPDFRGFGDSIQGMRFNFRYVVLKEFNTTFAWLLTIVAVEIWERIARGDIEGSPHAFGILWIALFCVYLVLMYCKKRKLMSAWARRR